MSSSGFANIIGSLLKATVRVLSGALQLVDMLVVRETRRLAYQTDSTKDLRRLLIRLFRSNPSHEYSPQQLFLLVRPPSVELLAIVLDELAREGVVRRIFRVESPRSHGGIKDFPSVAEIPEVLHDWTVDEDIEVDPSFIKPIFKTQAV